MIVMARGMPARRCPRRWAWRRRATRRGTDENVVAIFGDAALTNGISFEALNNIAHTTKQFIGILNDNEWSIAKNVGAIASYLNKLITNPRYNRLQKDFERWIRRMPKGRDRPEARAQGGRGAQRRGDRSGAGTECPPTWSPTGAAVLAAA